MMNGYRMRTIKMALMSMTSEVRTMVRCPHVFMVVEG